MEQEIIIEKQTPKKSRRSPAPLGNSKPKAASNKKHKERNIAVITIAFIIAAWLIGIYRESTDIEPYLHHANRAADRIEKSEHGNFAAYNADKLIGYVTIGEASGYGGPMQLAVATDLTGVITGIVVVDHIETPRWFERIRKNGLVSRMIGKSYNDAFSLHSDVDGVSGATYSSRGVANAALNGSRQIAKQELNFAVPPPVPAEFVFGIPEMTLIALFVLGIVGRRRSFKHTKKLRWLCMLTGMVMLGFVYTNPLTISMLNMMLLGFWPDWHTHLYWYLLIGGIIFSMTAFNKNPYCEWFCPFGAAQECMGKIGGAKAHSMRNYQTQMMWLQRTIAFLAILIALVYRNPGISSFEIFGTLFDLEGNVPQFFLLGLVLLVSLFVHRPWCRYLCPLKPIEALIKLIKTWTKESWLKIRPVRKT